VPYFLPRKWVKATPELATKATLQYIEQEKRWNERNPEYARKIKPYEEIYLEKINYTYPVPTKVGFNSCGLGWKTKWTSTDFRYEYGPVLSFVFFGYQIAIMIGFRDKDAICAYWESWLYYEYCSDKTKSKRERIEECRNKAPQTWSRNTTTIDYYQYILKRKYFQ
jgi:hypothetical protein